MVQSSSKHTPDTRYKFLEFGPDALSGAGSGYPINTPLYFLSIHFVEPVMQFQRVVGKPQDERRRRLKRRA